MRLHRNMRVQMVQCTVCLLASLPSTLVHAFNLFVAATRAFVLLSTWDWDKGVDLRKRVRILFQGLSQTDGVEGMRATHLTRTWSGTGWGSLGRGSCSRRAVGSPGHSMWMASVLLGPVLGISRRWMTLVVIHVVGRVWRIGWVGRTWRSNVRIYRYIRVRLNVWRMMMVIRVSILQGHRRTCCLSHTSCIGVTVLLLSVVLTRDVFWIQIGWTRRRWIHRILGRWCLRRRVIRGSPFLLRWVLRGRCWIWGSVLGSSSWWPKLKADVWANLTASNGRMHLCPSTATVANDASAWVPSESTVPLVERRINSQNRNSGTLMSLLWIASN